MNAEHDLEGFGQDGSTRQDRPQDELRVLAVDDDTNILQLLETALSAFQFDITICESGAAALKTIAQQDKPFDCFLLDIQMPVMNGILLCKEIRKLPEYRQAPILMLTAMSDREYVDLAFVAGATDYVTKPFDFLELRSRMSAAQRLVQERRIAQANAAATDLDGKKVKFPLDEPVAIENIDRVLKYTEFDNYIMQLSQGRLFNTHAVAVKITDVRKIHKSLSREAFEAVLRDVALSIISLTRKTGDIVSYRGEGVFLIVRHGRFAGQETPLENDINHTLLTRQSQRQAPTEAQVIAGDTVSLRSLSKSGSLMSVSRAIESVEQRDQAIRDQRGSTRRLLAGPPMTPEQEHNRKRAYESVLRDLIREEPGLRNE